MCVCVSIAKLMTCTHTHTHPHEFRQSIISSRTHKLYRWNLLLPPLISCHSLFYFFFNSCCCCQTSHFRAITSLSSSLPHYHTINNLRFFRRNLALSLVSHFKATRWYFTRYQSHTPTPPENVLLPSVVRTLFFFFVVVSLSLVFFSVFLLFATIVLMLGPPVDPADHTTTHAGSTSVSWAESFTPSAINRCNNMHQHSIKSSQVEQYLSRKHNS